MSGKTNKKNIEQSLRSIKQALAENRIGNALIAISDLCKELGDEDYYNVLVLLNAEYRSLRKAEISATISPEHYSTRINNLVKRIILLLSEIENLQVKKKLTEPSDSKDSGSSSGSKKAAKSKELIEIINSSIAANDVKPKRFNFSHQDLVNLPNKLVEVSNVVELNLSNNNFKVVPEVIEELRNIESLDLSANQISYLPEWITNLGSLKFLNLRDNQFNSIPEEIYNKPPKELINYILKNQNDNSELRPVNECKLIVVGSGGVGKTSLINMLTTGTCNPEEQKTDGIEIKTWQTRRDRSTIKINIWDFGGQEIMHATHQFFMTKRSIYLLVINPRIDDKYGDTELNYWLKLITSISPNSPLIISVNKCETHKSDFGVESHKASFPQLFDLIETSCVENIGISALKNAIKKAIKSVSHLDDKLPPNFFEIRRRLEIHNTAYLHYHQYVDLCRKVDSKIDDTMLKTYLGLLNDLGIMLNISENRRLENTQVLNPEWITKGVYSIINSSRLIENKGVIYEKELSRILDSKEYPTSRERGFIMDMMLHFELCFQMPGEKEVYFVPGTFPKDRPKNFYWEKDDNLRFIYKFDVLPSSIISRFIVRIHPFIYKNMFWRNGIVIYHKMEKNKSYISVNSAERKIVIRVNGIGNKRTTLSYIRTEFQKIFYTIEQLKVEGFIPLDKEDEHLISYEDLIAHEEMGEEYIVIPSLRIKKTVKQLLEGVENRINRQSLRKKIAEGKLDSVFEELAKIYPNNNEIIANLGRIRRMNENIRLGIGNFEEAENELRISLLEFIDELQL